MANVKRVWDSKKRAVRQDKKQVRDVNGELKLNGKGREEADTSKMEVYGSGWSEPQTPLQTYGNGWEEVVTEVHVESISLTNKVVNVINPGQSVNYGVVFNPENATNKDYTITANSDYVTVEKTTIGGADYIVVTAGQTEVAETTITVTSDDNAEATDSITIAISEPTPVIPTIEFQDHDPDATNIAVFSSVEMNGCYSGQTNFSYSGDDIDDLVWTWLPGEGIGEPTLVVSSDDSEYGFFVGMDYYPEEGESFDNGADIGMYSIEYNGEEIGTVILRVIVPEISFENYDQNTNEGVIGAHTEIDSGTGDTYYAGVDACNCTVSKDDLVFTPTLAQGLAGNLICGITRYSGDNDGTYEYQVETVYYPETGETFNDGDSIATVSITYNGDEIGTVDISYEALQ